MAGNKKPTFDPDAAFKSIINAGQEDRVQAQSGQNALAAAQKETRGKGRPKIIGETKKRVTLALYPSIYSDLQKIAYVKRKSISRIVSELIASYVNENTDTLHEYERIEKD